MNRMLPQNIELLDSINLARFSVSGDVEVIIVLSMLSTGDRVGAPPVEPVEVSNSS